MWCFCLVMYYIFLFIRIFLYYFFWYFVFILFLIKVFYKILILCFIMFFQNYFGIDNFFLSYFVFVLIYLRSVFIINVILFQVGRLKSFVVCWNNWDNFFVFFRYNFSLKILFILQLMGSYTEIRNYVIMIIRVLSRWVKEDRSFSCGQWLRIQDVLIFLVCRLVFVDQVWFRVGRVQCV